MSVQFCGKTETQMFLMTAAAFDPNLQVKIVFLIAFIKIHCVV